MLRLFAAGAARIVLLLGCSPRHEVKPAQNPAPPDAPSAVPSAAELEWRIVPARSVGFITRESSESDLARHYGPSVEDSQRIDIGEGETAPGAVLFPSDSLRRLEIIWQDTVRHARPARFILRGDSSRWTLDRGISLGTTLQELERLNGRPFRLAGFGWDYSGVVFDWSGGALDSMLPGVKLYLDPGPRAYQSAPYRKVLGDREYSSDLPAMRQLSPRVYQVFVDFDTAAR